MARSVTVVGDTAQLFGIADDELSLTTQKVSWTQKSDKKEVRNREGEVIAVAYYNLMTEFSIEVVGEYTEDIGAAITLTQDAAVGAVIILEEVTTDEVNEDFQRSTIKAVSYEALTASA